MSRSTVSDKLAGKSPLRLGHLLALVKACSDYAKTIGVELSPEDTDERVWSARLTTALAQRQPELAPERIELAVPPGVPAQRASRWDVEPLRRAGMHDIAEIVEAGIEGQTALWFPAAIKALNVAEMSDVSFMKEAAREPSDQTARTIIALTSIEEGDAAERLVYQTAQRQSPEGIPVLIAYLRRWEYDWMHSLSEKVVDSIAGSWPKMRPWGNRTDYREVWEVLQAATMWRDSARLLQGIGQNRFGWEPIEAALSFPDNIIGPRHAVLSNIGKGETWRIVATLEALKNKDESGFEKKKILTTIISGIPQERAVVVALALDKRGLSEEAEQTRLWETAPPF